jgi:hypothetical protein
LLESLSFCGGMVAKEERQSYDKMMIMDGCVCCLPLNYIFIRKLARLCYVTDEYFFFLYFIQMKLFSLRTKEFRKVCQKVPRQ